MILATHGLIASQIQSFVGLLDLYPSAAAAYSVRKLRTAYTGSAIRVRRSSDNTEQDIGFSGPNLDTSALTTFCGSGNGFVTTWYDQSGNEKNSIQILAANQPQIVSGGSIILENGKPTLQFDGSNDTLLTTITYNINSIYVEKIERFRTTIAGQMSSNFDPSQGPYFQWIQSANKFENYYGGSPTSTTATTTRKLYSFYASLGFYENGTLTAAKTTVVNQSVNTLNIGSYSTGINAFVNIQEFVLYTTNQISNRTGIESNINTYYGIY
jgi:hypothetical protein